MEPFCQASLSCISKHETVNAYFLGIFVSHRIHKVTANSCCRCCDVGPSGPIICYLQRATQTVYLEHCAGWDFANKAKIFSVRDNLLVNCNQDGVEGMETGIGKCFIKEPNEEIIFPSMSILVYTVYHKSNSLSVQSHYLRSPHCIRFFNQDF